MSVLAKFGEMNALADAQVGYQAFVCIYLAWGNDGHNMVIPISTAQQNFSVYQKGRQALALSQGTLLRALNGSDTYGLHPACKAQVFSAGSNSFPCQLWYGRCNRTVVTFLWTAATAHRLP